MDVEHVCGACGETFTARRGAKWCSDNCRKRKTPLRSASRRQATAEGEFAARTREQLERIGKLDTMHGQQALLIARRMEDPAESGIAALSKEHSRLVALLTRGESADPVDQVAKRRDAKRARASAG